MACDPSPAFLTGFRNISGQVTPWIRGLGSADRAGEGLRRAELWEQWQQVDLGDLQLLEGLLQPERALSFSPTRALGGGLRSLP